eukprot:CAMPEP_0180648782 /NCGR_PEP_ID=MMETSP1037_2-20121125/51178_1 /TAXON_ID=632150 /ORGANISM="Azadinium spinosum, Strain 3D9" /LENGTH=91 /DNA_ID=CAMNT_0022673673 /DNA_START=261 /DNA_END=534 /DNA_ORIENTATION=+
MRRSEMLLALGCFQHHSQAPSCVEDARIRAESQPTTWVAAASFENTAATLKGRVEGKRSAPCAWAEEADFAKNSSLPAGHTSKAACNAPVA